MGQQNTNLNKQWSQCQRCRLLPPVQIVGARICQWLDQRRLDSSQFVLIASGQDNIDHEFGRGVMLKWHKGTWVSLNNCLETELPNSPVASYGQLVRFKSKKGKLLEGVVESIYFGYLAPKLSTIEYVVKVKNFGHDLFITEDELI